MANAASMKDMLIAPKRKATKVFRLVKHAIGKRQVTKDTGQRVEYLNCENLAAEVARIAPLNGAGIGEAIDRLR